MNDISRWKIEKKRVVPTIGAFMVDYFCEEKQDERMKTGRRSARLGDGRDNDTINSRDEGHVSSSLCSLRGLSSSMESYRRCSSTPRKSSGGWITTALLPLEAFARRSGENAELRAFNTGTWLQQ
jgi:hypothetical protein